MVHIQVTLKCEQVDAPLSYDANTLSMKMVYAKISEVNPVTGKVLHDQGISYGKHSAKLCLARINPMRFRTEKESIQVEGDLYILNVRFYDEGLARLFSKAMLLNDEMVLHDRFGRKSFRVTKQQEVKPPTFRQVMQYQLRTPSVLSTKQGEERKRTILDPNTPLFQEKLQQHLLRRTELIYKYGQGQEGLEEGIEDLGFKLLKAPKRKSVHWKPSSSPKRIKADGYIFNFELIAPISVQKLIYYGGFLENTSLGFGYLDVLATNHKS